MNDLCPLILILIILTALILMGLAFYYLIPFQTLNWTIN